MARLVPAIAGAVFGAGLLVSGMTRPDRVVGFLDLGRWDPRLAFVMAGAVAVYALAYRIIVGRRREPWFDGGFHLPTRRDVDLGLIAGAAIFGVGWGLGGYCPGPGLVSAAGGSPAAIVFALALVAGMWLQHAARRVR
jgi:uncharacterized membrane protein YedE/YeeE